jgi:hypothetical protein
VDSSTSWILIEVISLQWDREVNEKRVVIHLTRNELRILNNSMNEALERVDTRLFSTLMGVDREEVVALLGEFRSLRMQLGAETSTDE